MKILILTDLVFPCDHAFLEEVFSKRFPENGHKITWIMRSHAYPDQKKIWNNSEVYTIKNFGMKGLKNTIKNTLNTFLSIRKLINEIPCDIIQVRNDPLMGIMAGYTAAKKGIPFVFQFSFLKSEGILYANRGYSDLIKGHIGRFMENIILKRADLILPISKTMAEVLNKRGIPPERLLPTPLGADEKVLTDEELTREIKEKWNIKDKAVIYVGTTNNIRKLDFLLRAFKLVLTDEPEAQLVFVGNSTYEQDMLDLIAEARKMGMGEKKVVFTGRVPRQEVACYIYLAKVCVSPIPPIEVFRLSSPTKLMEYLNSGRPAVANRGIVEQEEIIRDSCGGICVEYKEEDFAEAICYLLRNFDVAKKMGEDGRKFIQKERSYTMMAARLEKAYFNLIKPTVGEVNQHERI